MGRPSTRSPARRSVAPPRDAPTASLRARPGRHLAGASLRRPKTSHAGLTSRRGRRVTAVHSHQSVSADVTEKSELLAQGTAKCVVRATVARPTGRTTPSSPRVTPLCRCPFLLRENRCTMPRRSLPLRGWYISLTCFVCCAPVSEHSTVTLRSSTHPREGSSPISTHAGGLPDIRLTTRRPECFVR